MKDFNLNIFLICEATSCEFIKKYYKNQTPINSSSISDYGIIESSYFNSNPKNVGLFNDSNSAYLVETKGNCLDTSLIVYANSGENRNVYPIMSRFSKTKSNVRKLKEEFGNLNDASNYLSQNKFNALSDFIPSSSSTNISLNWKYENVGGATDINDFIKLLHKIKSDNENIENVFLVTTHHFIIEMMNNVLSNKYTSNDLIENTSMWLFKYQYKSKLFSSESKITSRNKIYPLGRNHGKLQIYDNVFFYYYKDIRVPLFYYNKKVPSLYIQPKYLTLCRIKKVSNNKNLNILATKRTSSNNIKSNDNSNKSPSLKKILDKIKTNKFIS
jgi:hypothetical protein